MAICGWNHSIQMFATSRIVIFPPEMIFCLIIFLREVFIVLSVRTWIWISTLLILVPPPCRKIISEFLPVFFQQFLMRRCWSSNVFSFILHKLLGVAAFFGILSPHSRPLHSCVQYVPRRVTFPQGTAVSWIYCSRSPLLSFACRSSGFAMIELGQTCLISDIWAGTCMLFCAFLLF